MDNELKLASNLAPFSRLSDRFVTSGYCGGYDFNKQLEMLAAIEGISGVGLGWPSQCRNGATLKKILENHGLKLATLDADIYTEARFKNGSFSNRNPKIRCAALERAKETIDVAIEAGSSDINLWLGHDGFDYLFQGHYVDAWNWILEGLQELAEYNPNMPISIEPKCREPRANEYVANTGKLLMLVNRINKPHVGITLDFGHSLAALENPAECAVFAMREGRLQQVHLNDNYRDWDHDLIPGSVSVWEQVEFFYWLHRLGYDGWFCIDIYPYRDDGAEVLERAVQACHKSWQVANRLIEMNIEQLLRDGQHLEIKRILWDMVKV